MKQGLKKLLSTSAVLTGLVALTACGQTTEGNETTQGTEEPTEPKVVTVTHEYGETEVEEYCELINAANSIEGIKNIGLVIPQKSLQTSLKDVFGGVKNLNKKMILTPPEVVKNYMATGEQYDLLIPDYAWETPMVQALLDVLSSDAFRARIEQLGGYRVDMPGRVRRHY